MRASSGQLGPQVQSVAPIGFETLVEPTSAVRRLLQTDTAAMNVTAILKMNEFGDVGMNVLKCVLLAISDMQLTISDAQATALTESCAAAGVKQEGIIMNLLSCVDNMQQIDTALCNELLEVLEVVTEVASVDWEFISKAKAAIFFTVDFDRSFAASTEDIMFKDVARSVVAEVIGVSVRHVVVEFKPVVWAEPGRRLLQASASGTQASIWVYRDTDVGLFNSASDAELMTKFKSPWKPDIQKKLKAMVLLQFKSMGVAVTSDIVEPETPSWVATPAPGMSNFEIGLIGGGGGVVLMFIAFVTYRCVRSGKKKKKPVEEEIKTPADSEPLLDEVEVETEGFQYSNLFKNTRMDMRVLKNTTIV
ncbi:hypothetical protein T484DRAFT_1757193 [Baffinella frigidus]|nr:hypothetical protein T484DRAFT_1757193 [Cryptophyta sp. CCMP2293]